MYETGIQVSPCVQQHAKCSLVHMDLKEDHTDVGAKKGGDMESMDDYIPFDKLD